MTRRDLLKTGVAAIAGVAALALPTAEKQEAGAVGFDLESNTMQFVTVTNPGGTGQTFAIDWFCCHQP
jgi:hypothetical protein